MGGPAGRPLNDGFALVVGESLVDIVPDAAGDVGEYPGGSPMNTAVGLARLGRDVRLATWYARDARGALVDAHLAASGVQVLPGTYGAARTPTAKVVFQPDGSARYVFDISWHVPEIPAEWRPLVVHAGSIGASRFPGCSEVLDVLRRFHPVATITYDPNARPHAIGDADKVRAQMEACAATSDVVKASTEDLQWLYPDRDPEASALEWLAGGPSLLVLTAGADGVQAWTKSGLRLRQDPPEVSVSDTVGAGDSFMAGLIHQLWRAELLGAENRTKLAAMTLEQLSAALGFATRTAAITLSRKGANPPWSTEL
ncbi:MAG: carbohydrate kinase [Propionibacteriaceae bacterium]|jgi:fructokinase|nr:carbohydrate kinase [Propionibacteriaceae bacterium]